MMPTMPIVHDVLRKLPQHERRRVLSKEYGLVRVPSEGCVGNGWA